ncbi:MAG: dephospho-CoA kinase [Candidatus Saganbacteria bacterium]|uniref:Dephospho-CoA kinase n=1 Tax=Candidatus Saganbacteria bacterium TaxID=2575572 RepID=A0A833L1R1_UNCSA|nr:MAG: dephospho-CoA kinase [Candidatus Saganbacteria bacterium]
MKNVKVIGLTGSIASGKSETARMLKKSGAIVIEADKIGHDLLNKDINVKAKIKKAFGTTDRKKFGDLVFADKNKLEQLNQILHPKMRRNIQREINRLKRKKRIIVIDAALPHLFAGLVDEVWVVIASKEKRLQRLIKMGLSEDDAKKRINSQMSQKEYLKLADRIIKNEGKLEDLKAAILV